MKRIAAVLAAAGLALAAAAPAHAAQGTLELGPRSFENPSGCYNFRPFEAKTVTNLTDETVTVHYERDCSGEVVGQVGPQATERFDNSLSTFSVHVP
ncbi:hypothetical protein HFP72_15535 [Nocardiopsis sp. ARC36]